MNPIVSEQCQFVIGVDTHAATHTVAVIAAATHATAPPRPGATARSAVPNLEGRVWR